jgi:hypothetical protein
VLQSSRAETGLAVRAVIRKTRQRETRAAFDARLRPGKQESLLMRWQQHIEFLLSQPLLDEGQIAGGVIPQSRAAVKFSDQLREPRKAPRRGIAEGTFGDKHPERILGIRHVGSLPRRTVLVSRFSVAIGVSLPSAGAAMQRYSWTNNR